MMAESTTRNSVMPNFSNINLIKPSSSDYKIDKNEGILAPNYNHTSISAGPSMSGQMINIQEYLTQN